MAKWAIGLRLPGSTDDTIENAFNQGAILRTHVMRPTWHFVAPKDIRWLLKLTAPRVKIINGFTYRQQNLDSSIFKRSNDIIAKALEGGKHLTRTELQAALKQKKIVAEGIRLICLMMQAELDGIICSGARKGKQHTYALLEERASFAKPLLKEEALVLFAERYFTSRGPATVRDFSTWSGLPVSDAKDAVSRLSTKFIVEKINGREYLFIPECFDAEKKVQTDFLMPDYDEYGMSYKDRTAIRSAPDDFKHFTGVNPVFNRLIILNGKIEGTWKRTIKNNAVVVETVPFRPLSSAKQRALAKAIKTYSKFAGNGVE
jgi:hypothetical protein